MKLCLNRVTTGGGLSLPEFVKLAADAGFQGADVDMGYGVQHGAAALRDLYASAGMAFGGWGPPEWRNDEAGWKAGLQQLDNLAKVASELGIDSCATWLMPSSDLPFQENFRFHATRIRGVAEVLAGHGLRFGLEFVGPYHIRSMFKHEFIFTPGLMLELAAAVGDNVGLLVDGFHLYTSGTPAEYLKKVPASKIVLAHVNDAPNVPVHQVVDNQRLLPGEGAIDQAAFREGLKAAGYTGPVSLEVFSRLKDVPPQQAARQAADACRAAGWM